MKKVIVNCKNCGKKIKIGYKPARYRCPYCKEIYILTRTSSIVLKIKSFFKGIKQTFQDIVFNMRMKYKNAKATYNYMKSMRENMKRDPSWSNYHKEKREEKQIKKADRRFWGAKLFKKK